MKRVGQIASGFAIVFVLVGSIQADGPLPWFLRGDPRARLLYEPRVPPPVPAHIETCADGPQARLIIPRKLLDNVRPAWASIQAPGDNASAWSKIVLPLGAGLALGLVLIAFAMIKSRRLVTAAGLALILIATFALSQKSRAHPIMPPPHPAILFKMTGQVMVEVVEEGDAVRLIFNKNQGITTQYGS